MRALDGVIAALGEHGLPASTWLVGEPCIPPPEALRDALAKAAHTKTFGYPPAAGLPRLREILAEIHTAAGTGTAPDQVVVTNGAKGGLLAVLATLLEPGDELIHPLPGYPAYGAMATRLGARAVPVAENNGTFDFWPQAVAEAVTPRTRAVVFSSPSNPTGATLTPDQAEALVELCRSREIRLVCDEAYGEFCSTPATHGTPAELDPERRTVVQVRSASKSWALCGWRIGWVTTDVPLAARIAARHSALLNPASGPAQEALTALPEVPDGYLDDARRVVSRRIDALLAALGPCGFTARRPAGGFYVWLDVSETAGDGATSAFCIDLARHRGVGLWPGEDFGGTGHVRLAVTSPSPEGWDSAVDALVAALTSSRSSGAI